MIGGGTGPGARACNARRNHRRVETSSTQHPTARVPGSFPAEQARSHATWCFAVFARAEAIVGLPALRLG